MKHTTNGKVRAWEWMDGGFIYGLPVDSIIVPDEMPPIGTKLTITWETGPRALTMDEARAESARRGWLKVDEFVPGFFNDIWLYSPEWVGAGVFRGYQLDEWYRYIGGGATQSTHEVTHWRPIVKPEPPEV